MYNFYLSLMENPLEVKNLVFFGICLVSLALMVFRKFFSRKILIVLSKFIFDRKVFSKIKEDLLSAVRKSLSFFIYVLALFLLGKAFVFNYPDYFSFGLYFLLISLFFKIFIIWFAYVLVEPILYNFPSLKKKFGKVFFDWFVKGLKILILFFGLTIILSFFGVSVVSLIASLGVVGIAVALGAQDLFKNIISGIVVISENRFKIGDIVKLSDGTEGVVEKVGFRSTAIRGFDKALVYVSNYNLSEGMVANFSHRPYRRILWDLGLEYNTSSKQLIKIRDEISKYIKNNNDFVNNEEIGFEVRIDELRDSSINIKLICFANTSDWVAWMKIKENLLLKVKEIVEDKVGANFAFPSQTLYLNK